MTTTKKRTTARRKAMPDPDKRDCEEPGCMVEARTREMTRLPSGEWRCSKHGAPLPTYPDGQVDAGRLVEWYEDLRRANAELFIILKQLVGEAEEYGGPGDGTRTVDAATVEAAEAIIARAEKEGFAELGRATSGLVAAAGVVIDRWERGDLAGAVRDLAAAVEEAEQTGAR